MPRTNDNKKTAAESSRASKPARDGVLQLVPRAKRGKTNLAAGDELGAAELAGRVAGSLKRFRRERQLSLDELSTRSGVSRAALSQIEGSRTNPTLAILWKIAVGLEVPFQDLLGGAREESIIVLRAGDTPPLRSGDGHTESRLLSPGGANGDTEVYELRLQPRAVHRSEPHARGTTETLVVLTGSVRIEAGGSSHDLAPGDTVFFRADVDHVYENRSAREARCINVIRYLRG
jgi:XRE family transcriptional regulator, regulator of sulfur utilization